MINKNTDSSIATDNINDDNIKDSNIRDKTEFEYTEIPIGSEKSENSSNKHIIEDENKDSFSHVSSIKIVKKQNKNNDNSNKSNKSNNNKELKVGTKVKVLTKEEEDLIELERYENEQRELFRKAVFEFRQSINPDYKESEFDKNTGNNSGIHNEIHKKNNDNGNNNDRKVKKVKFKDNSDNKVDVNSNQNSSLKYDINSSYNINENRSSLANQKDFLQNISNENNMNDFISQFQSGNYEENSKKSDNFFVFDNLFNNKSDEIDKKFEIFKSQESNSLENDIDKDGHKMINLIGNNNSQEEVYPDQNGIIYLPLNTEKFSCFNCYKLVVLNEELTLNKTKFNKEIEENGIFCSKYCKEQFTNENIVSFSLIIFRKNV